MCEFFMSVAIELLKANRVGIRDLKEHLSTKLLAKRNNGENRKTC